MTTVVLIPGLACDGEVWSSQLAALSPHHEVRVADVHRADPGIDEMAAALLAGHPGPLVLVGHSMGGMVALAAAAIAPRRIRAMALLSTSARPDTPEMIELRTQAIELFAAGRADEVLRANAPFAFHPRVAPATVAAWLAMVRRAGSEQLIAQNRAVMSRPDRRALLPTLACPLLVACGDADALTPPEMSAEIAAAARDARLEVIAGAGHMLTMEQPAVVDALLLDWLAGSGPGRRSVSA